MSAAGVRAGFLALLLIAPISAVAEPFAEAANDVAAGRFRAALEKWLPLAAKGHAPSQYNAGLFYLEGMGVPQDYKEAVRWLRLSANQDHATAQYKLAQMFIDGKGVSQNYQEAAKLLRAAAEQNEPAAQLYLGSLYMVGQGVSRDDVIAHMWLNLAAAQNEKDAAPRRDLLETILTRDQIAQAHRLAREWKPKTPNALPK